MTFRGRYLSRRTMLRGMVGGAALSLALPPLEAMLRLNGAWADGLDSEPFFGVFFWANGTPWHAAHGAEQAGMNRADLWTPATVGDNYAPSELLAPLANHRVSVITGLEPHTEVPRMPAGQSDGHMRGFMVAMTGDRPKPEGFDHPSHTLTSLRGSLDQYVARHPSFYGSPAPFRSIEAGASRARFHGYGHWNAISYNGSDSTNLPLLEPGPLFDRLFGIRPDNTAAERRSRALDAVLADAQSLRQRLGGNDRQRLDAHLDRVRDLQRRVDSSVQVCTAPDRPQESEDLKVKTRTMAELLAVAVECGLTRVFSFMLTSPASTHIFRGQGAQDGMHKVCHDGRWEQVRRITLYQMEAFSIFLDAFSRPGPDGRTLLDKGLIYGTSEYGEGWKHSVKELPVVLAGNALGRLNTMHHVREPGGNLAKAQLTALKAIGIETDEFGWNGAQTRDVMPGLLT